MTDIEYAVLASLLIGFGLGALATAGLYRLSPRTRSSRAPRYRRTGRMTEERRREIENAIAHYSAARMRTIREEEARRHRIEDPMPVVPIAVIPVAENYPPEAIEPRRVRRPE